MEAKAQHRFARMSSRKLRPLRMVLRGLPVKEAMSQLQFMPGKASGIVQSVLKSAIANATHNYEANEEELVVSDVIIEDAFAFKRFQPASKGSAHPIKKRTSHVTVLVEETGGGQDRVIEKKTNIQDVTAAEHWEKKIEKSEEVESEENNDQRLTKVVSEEDKERQVLEEQKTRLKSGDRRTTHRQQGK